MVLLDVKSHTQCNSNKLADKLAKAERVSDELAVEKYGTVGTLDIGIQPSLRCAITCSEERVHVTLPQIEGPTNNRELDM